MDFVPANALTHLTLEIGQVGTGQAEFVQLLRQCTMVESLQLPQCHVATCFPTTSLPCLKSLYVKDSLELDFQGFLLTLNLSELYLFNYWAWPYESTNLRLTTLKMETVTLDHQALTGLHHHHTMPFSSVKNLILRNCAELPVFARYLAGFPEKLRLQILTNPLK